MSKTETKYDNKDSMEINEDLYKADIKAQNGEGTEKNLEKAFYWYQKAAENGDIDAQYNLALLYKNGEGTEENLEKAFYWYQKAAENNVKEAQHNLALL